MIRKHTIFLFVLFLGFLLFSSNSFGTTHSITVQNYSFSPAMVNASVGDTITWQWTSGIHTTTCNGTFPGTSLPAGADPWDSPMTSSDTTFSYVLAVDGEYDYVCTIHYPNMGGVIMTSALPVELTSFSALVKSGVVTLNWQTATEKNNSGFEIQRKSSSGWEKISFVKGQGTTTEKQYYSFKDNVSNLQSEKIYYRLKQIDFDGTFEYSSEVIVSKTLPVNFSLSQNYPNPFNPSTQINYSVPKYAFVTLKIYDSNGKEVATLVNESKVPGNYDVNFNASKYASGIYFYTITANSFKSTKKMILMK